MNQKTNQNVKFNTLIELVQYRAATNPDKTIYTFLSEGNIKEDSLTFQELDQKAKQIAGLLQSVGKRGDRVILFFNPGLDYISSFFGCLYAGMIAVPSYPPKFNRNYQKILRLFQDSGSAIVLSSSTILLTIKDYIEKDDFFNKIKWIDINAINSEMANNWSYPDSKLDDLAFLQYTSGSTSDPKGVMVTHGNLLNNLQVINNSFGESENSSAVIWLPPYHDMGLIGGIMVPLYGAFPAILMSPFSFLQKPINWLNAISHYKATTSGGPNFAYELCLQKISEEQRDSLDLSSWKVAFNGAEPIHRETLDKFYEFFKPCGFRKEAFFPCYGLAEATLFVTGSPQTEAPVVCWVEEEGVKDNKIIEMSPDKGKTLVSNGKAFAGEKLCIVDPEDGTPCPPNKIGEVWVSSSCVARGYWNHEELTKKTFQAYIQDDGPYLRTGDLGFLKNNELYITGRFKDLIIIRGRNYYPQDIELTVEKSHKALAPNSGAAFSIEINNEEQLMVVFEVKRSFISVNSREVYNAVQQAIRENYDLELTTLVLIKPMSLPKTSSGKIQRNLCRKKYLENLLDIVGCISQEKDEVIESNSKSIKSKNNDFDIMKAIQETAAAEEEKRLELLQNYLMENAVRILKIDSEKLDINQPLNNYGFDSLMAVNFVHKIETDLKISLSMEFLLEGNNLAQLSSRILSERDLLTNNIQKIPDLKSNDTDKCFPLSHNQQSLFFMSRLVKDNPVYNLSFAVRFVSELNIAVLKESLQEIIKYNSSLRTTFTLDQNKAVQIIHNQIDVSFKEVDVCNKLEEEYKNLLTEESLKPFDLENGPLFRVIVFKKSAAEYHMFMVIHHIISDFWSLTIMVKELSLIYSKRIMGSNDYESLLSGKPSYINYVQWQTERLAKRPQLQEYWKKQLEGELPVLNLCTDYPRPAIQTYKGSSGFIKLENCIKENLKDFSSQNGVTVYMMLFAVFQILLHKYSGQDDILVGSLTSGRQSANFSEVMGYFINPIVLRSDMANNPEFIIFLKQVQKTVLKAFESQEYPFDLLVEQLQIQRDLSRSPIFQVMFIYQNSPNQDLKELNAFALNETEATIDLNGLSMQLVPLNNQIAQFDLTLVAAELPDGLGLSLQYNSDLFNTGTIARMIGHFEVLLKNVLENPNHNLSELQILNEAERNVLLNSWNNTYMEYKPVCLHNLIEEQVELTPDSIAICFNEIKMTYRELNIRANRLAQYLIKQGLSLENPVALCMERSIEMVIGLLGILKAGGYYLPLDPMHPRERLAMIIEDAGENNNKPIVLTQEKLLGIFSGHTGKKVCIDRDWSLIEKEPGNKPDIKVDNNNLAYTIYTSGSTGKPKGVQISHKAVVNFLKSMSERPGITSSDILLSVTTVSFDIAGLEIYLPLSCGAQVIIASENIIRDGKMLAKEIEHSGVTIMQGTPSIWRLLLESGWNGSKTLKILCGGEAFPPELANQLITIVKEVWNMYGPTETTIWSTIYKIEKPMKSIPIGRPIGNTKVYILDQYLKPVPVGVSGELYIGGTGVARGYYNQSSLTNEKFIPDPFQIGMDSLMYKTGDLTRYLEDGNIEFSGRLDHQVKIRGYRIEIGEIESILNKHRGIQASLVIAKDSKTGTKQLIAYIIPENDEMPDVSELHRFLKEKLPDYMIPSFFIPMQGFPQTPNGKIDRKMLPDPEYSRPDLENTYVAPKNRMEERITAIWQEALKLDKVGIHDNFFELGGNSMLMVQIHNRLSSEFPEREISIVELFQYPTITALAIFLSSNISNDNNSKILKEEHIESRKSRTTEIESQREMRKKSRSEF